MMNRSLKSIALAALVSWALLASMPLLAQEQERPSRIDWAENVYQPNIELRMSVKVPVTVQYPDPPFKSDEEALAFWDAVTSTLRLRPLQGPGGQTLVPDGTPPPTARVGEVCPKGGIWRAWLPPSHPSAQALAASGPYRFKEVQAGQPMPLMYLQTLFKDTADADNAAVVWHWVKKDGSA